MRICRAREKKNRDCTTNRLYYIVAECQIAFIASHLTNEVLFRVFIVVACFTLKFIVFTRAQMMIVERNKHFEEEEANKQKNRNTE